MDDLIGSLVKRLLIVTSYLFIVGVLFCFFSDTSVSAGNADHIQLKDTSYCLNTPYRYEYGNINIYQCNGSDVDQDWVFEGNLVRLKNTQFCLNTPYRYENGNVFLWTCNSADPDQQWEWSGDLLRLKGTNFCLNTPYRYNEGNVFLWSCNSSDPDQRWQRGSSTSPSDICETFNWGGAGTYCDGSDLVTCDANKNTIGRETCNEGCQTNPPGDPDVCITTDFCQTVPWYDAGTYCNGNTLVTCSADRQTISEEYCSQGCQVNPPYVGDVCVSSYSDVCETFEWGGAGTYCYGDDLVYCNSDKVTQYGQTCYNGCQTNPPYTADECSDYDFCQTVDWNGAGYYCNGYERVYCDSNKQTVGGESCQYGCEDVSGTTDYCRSPQTNESTVQFPVNTVTEFKIESGFGYGDGPINSWKQCSGNSVSNTSGREYHAGVDVIYATSLGTNEFDANNPDEVALCKQGGVDAEVVAIGTGDIVNVYQTNTEGWVVTQRLNETYNGQTVYASYVHLDRLRDLQEMHTDWWRLFWKSKPQPVNKGQILGQVADVGNNPHLHFEMKTFPEWAPYYSYTVGDPDDDGFIDPCQFFKNKGAAVPANCGTEIGGPGPDPTPTPVPVQGCTSTPTGSFCAEYFNSRDLNNLALSRNDNQINFDWGGGSPGTEVQTDNFSAKWQGRFSFDAAEYEFNATADDGVRLYIDGALVIDQWVDQSPTTHTYRQYMSTGEHEIRMEYYENAWGAVAQLDWEKIVVQSQGCSTPAENAFCTEYYDNQSLSGIPVITTAQSNIDHNWGDGQPDSVMPADNFSMRWWGKFYFTAGEYTFTTATDDGVRLYVDGQLLIDKWIDQGTTEHLGIINFSEGWHEIKMEYYENGGGAVARLNWEQTGTTGSCVYDDGFCAQYFNNMTLSGDPVVRRTEDSVTHDWGTGSPDAAISPDQFSARWEGDFHFDAGDYLFVTATDDGVRLWINDELVIDKWVDQGTTSYEHTRYMNSGTHHIRMEYYENGGDAVAWFWWEGSTSGVVCDGSQIGSFCAQYYDNMNLSGDPVVVQIESSISYDWGGEAPLASVPADYFSTRWRGYYTFEEGTYRFRTYTDDGVRLYVNGSLIINQWVDQSPTEHIADVWLPAGTHEVKMEYYENGWGAVADLFWQRL